MSASRQRSEAGESAFEILKTGFSYSAIFLPFAVAVALAETYVNLQKQFNWPLWAAAACSHAVIACLLYFHLLLSPNLLSSSLKRETTWLFYLPAAAVGLFNIAFTFFGWRYARFSSPPLSQTFAHALAILLIPAVEEAVFRLGIGGLCKRLIPPGLASAYVSALIFSWLHSVPTLERCLNGETGIFLGPLLLGLACEGLYFFSGRLLPGVLLHAACNGTVVIASLQSQTSSFWIF